MQFLENAESAIEVRGVLSGGRVLRQLRQRRIDRQGHSGKEPCGVVGAHGRNGLRLKDLRADGRRHEGAGEKNKGNESRSRQSQRVFAHGQRSLRFVRQFIGHTT